jgi:hypothetical protein
VRIKTYMADTFFLSSLWARYSTAVMIGEPARLQFSSQQHGNDLPCGIDYGRALTCKPLLQRFKRSKPFLGGFQSTGRDQHHQTFVATKFPLMYLRKSVRRTTYHLCFKFLSLLSKYGLIACEVLFRKSAVIALQNILPRGLQSRKQS